jgi:hypothetical protein
MRPCWRQIGPRPPTRQVEFSDGAVAGVVGNLGGVASGLFNEP